MHFISTFKKYTQESKPVNPRIIVGAVAGLLVVILAVFALAGTSIVSDVGGGFLSPPTQQQVLPLEIELFDLSILEVTEKQATLQIKFKVSNPNFKSVMLQHIKYSVYHNESQRDFLHLQITLSYSMKDHLLLVKNLLSQILATLLNFGKH